MYCSKYSIGLNLLKTHFGNLTLLTPTDCIKDRLCALVYHGGEECFSHAVAVAHLNKFDKDLINWAKKEDPLMLEKVDMLLTSVSLLQKEVISNKENIKYLDSKAKDFYLDIFKESNFEDSQYYKTMDIFYKKYISK